MQPDSPAGGLNAALVAPERSTRPRPRLVVHASLTAVVVGCIAALTGFQLAGSESGAPTTLRVLLAIAFAALAIIDFRSAAAIAIFELALMGAGGRWTEYGGGITGRHVLDGIVTACAAVGIVRDASAGRLQGRHALGRYGWHALALAIVFPAVWMTLGVVHGNAKSDVLGDGNGFVFFAFALVIVRLLQSGSGSWLRRCFRAACATNGVVTAALIVLATTGVVSLDNTLHRALITRLDEGGVVGTMPNGAFRLYLGSSLYLQVGLALVTYELLRRPRCAWAWLLYAILWFGLIGTYTRGLWLGAVLACALVMILGSLNWRRPAAVVGGTVVLFGLTSAAGLAFGRSLPHYLFSRSTSVVTSANANASAVLEDRSFEHRAVGRRGPWFPVDSPPRSLAWAVAAPGLVGARTLSLRNDIGGNDDYVAQTVKVRPHASYRLSAWFDASRVTAPAAAERGLVAWDPVNGRLFTIPIPRPMQGWKRIAFGFAIGRRLTVVQIRLYAPRGTVLWDDVRLTETARITSSDIRVTRQDLPPEPAAAARAPSASRDIAGEVSNAIRAEQFHVLARHIRARPILGSGFGSIARDYPYGTSYSYELSYLDLLFKAGVVGLLLFLSFPIRLAWDALLGTRVRLMLPRRVRPRETSVVVGMIVSILLVGATNPYLFAAFGLCPILIGIAWLDERVESDRRPTPARARSRDETRLCD